MSRRRAKRMADKSADYKFHFLEDRPQINIWYRRAKKFAGRSAIQECYFISDISRGRGGGRLKITCDSVAQKGWPAKV